MPKKLCISCGNEWNISDKKVKTARQTGGLSSYYVNNSKKHYKPSSVSDDHLSGTAVADSLYRPT